MSNIAIRVYIAGMLRNSPDNLMFWLRHPQEVVPGNVMPDMGMSAPDARDVAAYLYTLRYACGSVSLKAGSMASSANARKTRQRGIHMRMPPSC